MVDDGLAAGRSPLTVTGSGFVTEGDFRVSSLAIDAGGDFTVGAGDTVTVGALSTSGGTLRFALGAASEGFVEVTGAGNRIDLTGTTVAATVDPDRPLNVGDEIRVGTGNAAVVGQSGATGQALTRIDDDSLLFDFLIADGGQAEITSSADATDLFFRVAQAGTASENALTFNTQSVGAAVDALAGTSDPALSSVLLGVTLASTTEELEAILQATLPQIDRSSLLTTQMLTNNTVRLVSDRLTFVRDANTEPAAASAASRRFDRPDRSGCGRHGGPPAAAEFHDRRGGRSRNPTRCSACRRGGSCSTRPLTRTAAGPSPALTPVRGG